MGLIKSANLAAAVRDVRLRRHRSVTRRRCSLRAGQQAEQLLAVAQREADARFARERWPRGLAWQARGRRPEGGARRRSVAKGAAEGKAAAMKENRRAPRRRDRRASSSPGRCSTRTSTRSPRRPRPRCCALALAIARKRHVKTLAARDPSPLSKHTIREAVRLAIKTKSSLRIAVSSRAAGVAGRNGWRAEVAPGRAFKHVELIDDAAVDVGGCRVMTPAGEIDADIDSAAGSHRRRARARCACGSVDCRYLGRLAIEPTVMPMSFALAAQFRALDVGDPVRRRGHGQRRSAGMTLEAADLPRAARLALPR